MTPGTLTDDPLLDGRTDNYLAAVAMGVSKSDGYKTGLAWIELSTGDCVATSAAQSQILDEIARLRPAEIIVPEHASGQPHEIAKAIAALGLNAITPRPGWQFTPHHAKEQVQKQWGAATTAGFGFAEDDPRRFPPPQPCFRTWKKRKNHRSRTCARLRRHSVENYLLIDPSSWRSLEVDRTVRSGGQDGYAAQRD